VGKSGLEFGLLTPEVLQYLFTCKKTFLLEHGDDDDTVQISLTDVIFHGFADGLLIIRWMIHNNSRSNKTDLELQEANFKKYTCPLCQRQ
jgi:hypothetical protein